jgi:hypothetical protein
MMVGKFSGVVIAASVMFAGVAYAGESGNSAALAQGKPAGVKNAVSFSDKQTGLLLVGGAAVIAGVVLVATGDSNGSVSGTCTLVGCTSTTTTTTTPTTTNTTTTTTTTKTK